MTILSPEATAQDHFPKSTTSVGTMDSGTSPGPFPFFKLPPEVRNMIYRLVVITEKCLVVRDMHYWDFEKYRGNGAYQSRSTYLAPDHLCNLDTSPLAPLLSCLQKDERFGPTKTTYMLGTTHLINKTTVAMLSLNKQSREEVASIFYGENTFKFTTMSSLMPFMKDRTPETRKFIQQLWLHLVVDERNWDTIFAEQGRPAIWNKAFSSLLKLPQTKIRKLCIEIVDKGVKVNLDGPNLRARSMLWLHKLRRFDNLEMLGLIYTLGDWRVWERYPNLRGMFAPLIEEMNKGTGQALWDFLAPKMLKKEADDHTPEGLQQRRIWDFAGHRQLIAPADTSIF